MFNDIIFILLFSPFYFLHFSWDDAFFCYFSLSFLAASWVSAPLFFWFLYLFLKPALLPHELSLLHLALLLLCFTAFSLLICIPLLSPFFPDFLLSYHSDSFLFSPSVLDLLYFALDFSSCGVLLLSFPFLVLSRFSRAFLYLFAFLFAASFLHFPLSPLIFFFLSFNIETSLLFLFFYLSLPWGRRD